ncbi:MAG: precorrin-8X methylmutase [Magnetospirillum sp. WYHS-4]
MDYIRDPAEIYRQSFRRVRAAADFSAIPKDLRALAERLVHTAGDPTLVPGLAFGHGAGRAGRKALAAGAPILCDVEMVAHGITRSRLPAGNEVICLLNAPGVRATAQARQVTRSMAAVDLWLPRLEGAVVAIGNAPTALFRLLELLRDGAPRPALILGFPVGFVGAAESKEALMRLAHGIPYVTLAGRRGGSALAAAAVNALCGDAP